MGDNRIPLKGESFLRSQTFHHKVWVFFLFFVFCFFIYLADQIFVKFYFVKHLLSEQFTS